MNLVETTSDNVSRFITKKWVEVYDQSGWSYNTYKQIRFKTSMLRSDLCDCSDAYIVIKETITVTDQNNDVYYKRLAFKYNALFISCISKINNTLIHNAEYLGNVIAIYNLTVYSRQKIFFKKNRKFLELL